MQAYQTALVQVESERAGENFDYLTDQQKFDSCLDDQRKAELQQSYLLETLDDADRAELMRLALNPRAIVNHDAFRSSWASHLARSFRYMTDDLRAAYVARVTTEAF